MGVTLKGLYEPEIISVDSLSGRIIAVDAYNMLYQFLTTIRGYDGNPLMDSKGRVTSHIQGLFSRVTALMESGVKLVFVFDGTPPDLKQSVLAGRKERKQVAREKYLAALEDEDTEAMHKYSKQTTVLTKEMAAQAKEFLTLLGIPCIDAPAEGEAQAAHMCKRGDVYAVCSQDADALVFGAPIVVRNLSVAGRRKIPGKQQWVIVEPQKIVYNQVLATLSINEEQLAYMAMLIGCDYAPGGIKGVGPKNALKLVKSMDTQNPEKLFDEVKWNDHHDVPWQNVYNLLKNPQVTDDYDITPGTMQVNALQRLLEGYEFSSQRIEKTIASLIKQKQASNQKGLADFFT